MVRQALFIARFSVGCLVAAGWASTATAADIDFNRDIRPILSDICYRCHGPDAGTREADLILGSFSEVHLAAFDGAQLDRYEALLAWPDPDIFDWLAGRCTPPPECDHDVTRMLLSFRYTPRPT